MALEIHNYSILEAASPLQCTIRHSLNATSISPKPPLSLYLLRLLFLPFIRCEAFGCPGMNGCNLSLQRGIDEPVPREAILLLKKR